MVCEPWFNQAARAAFGLLATRQNLRLRRAGKAAATGSGKIMFAFQEGVSAFTVWGVWLAVFAALFAFNEFARRWKWAGFLSFVVLPAVLSALWFTVLKKVTYTDWFHLAKVYSSTAGCIGFWCIRHVQKKDKLTGEVKWRLADSKIALCFP